VFLYIIDVVPDIGWKQLTDVFHFSSKLFFSLPSTRVEFLRIEMMTAGLNVDMGVALRDGLQD
jgi:hypothetical protein